MGLRRFQRSNLKRGIVEIPAPCSLIMLEQADAKRDVKMATEVITARCCLLMLVRKVLLSDTPTLVSLRIDRDILDHFQEAGPGWQDRINETLRKVIGK